MYTLQYTFVHKFIDSFIDLLPRLDIVPDNKTAACAQASIRAVTRISWGGLNFYNHTVPNTPTPTHTPKDTPTHTHTHAQKKHRDREREREIPIGELLVRSIEGGL